MTTRNMDKLKQAQETLHELGVPREECIPMTELEKLKEENEKLKKFKTEYLDLECELSHEICNLKKKNKKLEEENESLKEGERNDIQCIQTLNEENEELKEQIVDWETNNYETDDQIMHLLGCDYEDILESVEKLKEENKKKKQVIKNLETNEKVREDKLQELTLQNKCLEKDEEYRNGLCQKWYEELEVYHRINNDQRDEIKKLKDVKRSKKVIVEEIEDDS